MAQFAHCGAPDFVEVPPADHVRIETRRIWCSTTLNDYVDFPHVGQTFRIERECIQKKNGKRSLEVALGITSRTPQEASPQRLLEVNRGHWAIESVHYLIDWNFNEHRSRVRSGFGPENLTRLRLFAIGIFEILPETLSVYRRNDVHPLLPHPSHLQLSAHDKKLSTCNTRG